MIDKFIPAKEFNKKGHSGPPQSGHFVASWNLIKINDF